MCTVCAGRLHLFSYEIFWQSSHYLIVAELTQYKLGSGFNFIRCVHANLEVPSSLCFVLRGMEQLLVKKGSTTTHSSAYIVLHECLNL
ncbi:2'-deoxynucleoside 5'-phosphate N-hydrolase 1 [Frankliniella fusca]|uniref:2'-deoxynucleoside 5'-phosphate N-hydrolase 1 n=1 Tax=Frankliniella fusca TaxID=407009 RepID=A0AAE1GTS7_9NEOP|nr:2'-deoxynucleoside 5'-phosphate N-hydrolase 1 [Frankliniella fusca]